jgi:hypothetical protein
MQSSFLLTQIERYRFIRSSVKYLCREPRFRHKWRTSDHLATLCHKWFTIPEPLKFNGNDLNNALLRDPALKLDMKAEKSSPNQFGIYYDTYRPRDTNKQNQCYYLCDPDCNEYVNNPPVGKAWYDTIPNTFDEIQALERATRNKEQRQFPPDVIDLVSKANHHTLLHKQDKLEDERPAKRSRLLEITSNTCHSTSNSDGCNNGTDEVTDTSPGPKPPQLAPGFNIWWDSQEAIKLFNASKEKETAIDRLEDLIAVLENANSTALLSYKTIVEGHDADDTMSEHKKEGKRMKARYLAQTYRIAIAEMPFKTWNDCCREAINQLATVHINYINNEKVLRRCNVEFRKRKTFCVKSRGKRDLPAFLEAHPIVISVMKEYWRENLSEL